MISSIITKSTELLETTKEVFEHLANCQSENVPKMWRIAVIITNFTKLIESSTFALVLFKSQSGKSSAKNS